MSGAPCCVADACRARHARIGFGLAAAAEGATSDGRGGRGSAGAVRACDVGRGGPVVEEENGAGPQVDHDGLALPAAPPESTAQRSHCAAGPLPQATPINGRPQPKAVRTTVRSLPRRGEPSPGADVAGVARGEPSLGADVAGVSKVPVQMWQG